MDWKEWFEGQVDMATMRVSEVPLSEAAPWGLQEDGRRFGRPDGTFFNLVGLEITTGREEREVRCWKQPLLQEATGPGVVILACRAYDDQDGYEYLVSAKSEPGNDTLKGLILAPSLQASLSNLQQAHGGKRPPRAELYDQVEQKGGWRSQRKDGARFYHKTDQYAVIEVASDLDLASHERWFAMGELLEARDEGLLNEHLVLALALGVFMV